MDFVLAFSLGLALLSIRESYTEGTEQTNTSCYEKCPPGYHKESDCDDPVGQFRCKKCDANTFTDIENSILRCERCDTCEKSEEQIKPCSFNSNVVCECKTGYYNEATQTDDRRCVQCPTKGCKDGKGKQQPNRACKNCLKNSECKKICLSNTTTSTTTTATTTATTSTTATATTSTTTTTTTPTSTTTFMNTASSNNTPSTPDIVPVPTVNYLTLMFLVLVVVTITGLFWLLFSTLFIRNLLRYSDVCPCWDTNKDLEPPAEDPIFNEQHSHQGCSPTTLTLNISEETPMMTLSQSPEHPAHIGLLVPDTEHKAARQKVQSKHWPAIVLYAIIREVPLRRWKEFLRLLSVADQQLERVELEAGMGLGFTERQYQMLRLWSQRSSASLNDVFSALHYMDLSGCAQLLQESLEKLQWQPEPMH
ncbi:tumor necrosis factor receptor superfamily member 1A-like isoform X2 [Thunnus maccoyii]|uniref:tumor necrosis factor receptor superfamily member 1A-like isoform X2 n=1 Tax=Thunnus maccoyii TaxID=8240 RepID=UPI001C4A8184|nr:tumor necrosis factor receptor superfamily member 1A-like isoform X2 [Thunnus maccoyii]